MVKDFLCFVKNMNMKSIPTTPMMAFHNFGIDRKLCHAVVYVNRLNGTRGLFTLIHCKI